MVTVMGALFQDLPVNPPPPKRKSDFHGVGDMDEGSWLTPHMVGHHRCPHTNIAHPIDPKDSSWCSTS